MRVTEQMVLFKRQTYDCVEDMSKLSRLQTRPVYNNEMSAALWKMSELVSTR